LENASATDEAIISVTTRANATPVADAGTDRSARVGEPIVFDASASHDPDGAILAYAWDFGNGAVSTGIDPVYAYQDPGVYIVKLRVWDNSGLDNGSSFDTIAVSIAPQSDPDSLSE
jgi:PKD repeat protein